MALTKLLQGRLREEDFAIRERELELLREDPISKSKDLIPRLYETRTELILRATVNYVSDCIKNEKGYAPESLAFLPLVPFIAFGASFMPTNKDPKTRYYIARCSD